MEPFLYTLNGDPSPRYVRDLFVGPRTYPFEAEKQLVRGRRRNVRVQIGDLRFLDDGFRFCLPDPAPNASLLYLSQFRGALRDELLMPYSGLALAAMESVPLDNEVFLDLGCKDGVLSLLSRRRGCAEAFAVDKDPLNRSIIDAHLQANDLHKDAITFWCGDIIKDPLQKYLPLNEITVAAANLGPHYGGADLAAIKLLRHMPNVHTFIGGGYCAYGQFNAKRARHELKKVGFSQQYNEFTQTEGPLPFRISFTLKRS